MTNYFIIIAHRNTKQGVTLDVNTVSSPEIRKNINVGLLF